jgi:hypothetical protein
MCVNLIPGHTYYEHSVWVLKLGVIEWYQSLVNHRNASLVRIVIFNGYFQPKLFYSIPPQNL